MNSPKLLLALGLGLLAVPTFAAVHDWMPSEPGPAKASVVRDRITLENRVISLTWYLEETSLRLKVKNGWTGEMLDTPGRMFDVVIPGQNGGTSSPFLLRSSAAFTAKPMVGGKAFTRQWTDATSGLQVTWTISLRDDSNYVRTELELLPTKGDVRLPVVDAIDITAPNAAVVGKVPGSPIVAKSFFFGAEHPMAVSRVYGDLDRSFLERALPLKSGLKTSYSAVLGVSPAGQTRRAFNRYIERERPRPYKPFLHYNSWYDLGYFNRYKADECVERIKTFGDQLTTQRGVKLSSFLFDDGWDNTATVWEFSKDFPEGFTPLKAAAEAVGAGPGAWLSPWGGYGTPRKERLATGKAAGMEIDSQGYALSGPKYYQRFREVCLDLVTKYGINQFKFDGTGSPDKQYPGSQFSSDFEAAIQLIQDLRAAKPGLFINLTTGTWPSPFWTRYADSIWRGGSDHEFAGVGPDREKWVTYRDGDTYHGIVQKGPLFSVNSLMLHGLIYAQHAHNLTTDPSHAFVHELHSYFGTGTQLQEMYITPSLLSKEDWDNLAECAKWSQANADVFVDTHWIGGDPLRLDVYGWASWNPRKAILVLRNPSDHPQAFSIDPAKVFELPPKASTAFNLKSPYQGERNDAPVQIHAGQSKVVVLQPFQVLTLEGAGQ